MVALATITTLRRTACEPHGYVACGKCLYAAREEANGGGKP